MWLLTWGNFQRRGYFALEYGDDMLPLRDRETGLFWGVLPIAEQ
jgi:hypothetical protein